MTQEQKTVLDPAQIEARAQELAEKDTLSAGKLKEFVYLVWNNSWKKRWPGVSLCYGYMHLPSKEQRRIGLYVGSPQEDYVRITFLDGIREMGLADPSGEIVELHRGVGTDLEWRIGIQDTYYS